MDAGQRVMKPAAPSDAFDVVEKHNHSKLNDVIGVSRYANR